MFLRAAGFAGVVAPFERNASIFNVAIPSTAGDLPFRNVGYSNPQLAEVSQPYICAWDVTTGAAYLPKLIRITVAVDEPNGRLNNEQTYEYVFELPN